jgi:hypothetical protein
MGGCGGPGFLGWQARVTRDFSGVGVSITHAPDNVSGQQLYVALRNAGIEIVDDTTSDEAKILASAGSDAIRIQVGDRPERD